MRGRGIAYDTGFVRGGITARRPLELERVKKDLTAIRDDLHCNAVHIIGGDPERLERAARCAVELGLEVWFSPYPLDLTPDELRALFLDCAVRAERLRADGGEITFVAGVELSIMNRRFLVGDDINARIHELLDALHGGRERLQPVADRLDQFFRTTVPMIRERFHGPVTYAAIQFEHIDWDLFDIITLELIRSADVADRFREGVRALTAQPKPVAITGFGCATWHGAGDVAPRSMEIIETDPATDLPIRLSGDYERDEAEQARYLSELLEIFDSEGVDSAFVYLFALTDFPHRPGSDPRDDLDIASLGIVKIIDSPDSPDSPDSQTWQPKEAFTAVAKSYSNSPDRNDGYPARSRRVAAIEAHPDTMTGL
jgi:hypothetical protein